LSVRVAPDASDILAGLASLLPQPG